MRTQQIIAAAETGVANTVDPVAGSYAVEAATTEIERGAQELLDRIELTGGTLAAIESGLIQREIQESAYRAQLAVDSGESVVIGVNRFAPEHAAAQPGIPLLQIDPAVERQQIERLRSVRATRNGDACRASLDALSKAATDGGNLVPHMIAAVEARVTVGEISDALRAVFGEFRETNTW